MNIPEEGRKCPKCGAPVLSEVCQFCGTYIGEAASSDLTSKYPLVECRNLKVELKNVDFPLIFGGVFLCVSVPLFIISFFIDDMGGDTQGMGTFIKFLMIPFMLGGLAAVYIAIKKVFSIRAIKKTGVVEKGIVYGYTEDKVTYSGVNGQMVNILVESADGKKLIRMPLGTTAKVYEVNSEVHVLINENYAMITNKKVKW